MLSVSVCVSVCVLCVCECVCVVLILPTSGLLLAKGGWPQLPNIDCPQL